MAAHKPSDSYLSLTVHEQRIDAQWDIALRDLDFAIGLDGDGNGALTWGEVKARHTAISAYALSRLSLSSGGAVCAATVTEQLIDQHSDGSYSVLRFSVLCPAKISTLVVDYRLLFDIDPQHKGLLKLTTTSGTTTAIFSPDSSVQQFDMVTHPQLKQFVAYLETGIWHIWIGLDHILFLLSLLLPAVLIWRDKERLPAPSFKFALIDVLKIVTAFTLAHSITLTLATLGVVALPSRVTESLIALSVIFAAMNNLWPMLLTRRWTAAFGFGLIHGFGFASVLTDLGLPKSALLWSLVAFNLGVEVGQLTIVAVFLPVAFALRRTWFYRTCIFLGGSWLIVVIALVWLCERALNLKLITV